jgi:hypothetical protein
VEELYDALDMTYAASLGRIRKRAQLDTRLHARLEQSTGEVADVAPSEQLAELFLSISAYMGRSTGAVRRGAALTGRDRKIGVGESLSGCCYNNGCCEATVWLLHE